jgi:hypothetical protein
MNLKLSWSTSITVLIALSLSACSTSKLEARLEANPQCKEVVNPKTGALMPCPGSDRSFYVAAGLEAPRPVKVVATPTIGSDSAGISNSRAVTPTAAKQATVNCKPQIHKKTGGVLPCPPED